MQNKITTTKPFMSGRSQAIRIPKEYRFNEEELYINKIGDALIITPLSRMKETFETGLSLFTDDFLSEGRPDELPNERITL